MMRRTRRISAFALALMSMHSHARADGWFADSSTFLRKRKDFQTHLVRHAPSPQHFEEGTPPSWAQVVHYPSCGRQLRAWLARPAESGMEKRPVLVYFHGSYSFSRHDMLLCQPFVDAGFIVMTPMLRAENGNPGNFEMYMGEVDDARNAVRWVARQEGVDAGHIYTFGHSAGGVISALLSLFDDYPVRLTGSSGGLYGHRFFPYDKMTPFDTRDPRESELRSLIGNVRDMKHRHIAYIGSQDKYQEASNAREEAPHGSRLTIHTLAGGHFSVLPESIELYLRDAIADMGPAAAELNQNRVLVLSSARAKK